MIREIQAEKPGTSRETAIGIALGRRCEELGLDALGGALSGGLMAMGSGGSYAVQSRLNKALRNLLEINDAPLIAEKTQQEKQAETRHIYEALGLDAPEFSYKSKETFYQPDIFGFESTDLTDNTSSLTSIERDAIIFYNNLSDEIRTHISSPQEAKIYQNARVHETFVDGRLCLIKDIDLNYIDSNGMSNRDRILHHLSPIDSQTGEVIALHHMGQGFDAPFVELCFFSEHGDGNHKTLHPIRKGSWRNVPGQNATFRRETRRHWKARLGGN